MLITLIFLTKCVNKLEINRAIKFFSMLGMILATIVVPIAVLVGVFQIFKNIIPAVTIGKIKNDAIKKITKPLVSFYNVPQDYIVTKCYLFSADDHLKNKDVIVYIYKGKIRVVNDFYHSIKDFGCYEFDYDEITYFNINENGVIKTAIKTDKIEIILGYRAGTFIKHNKNN